MIKHEPVLLNEVIDLLKIKSNHNGIDCTMGGGGHAVALLKKISPAGKLLGIDWDQEAIKIAQSNLQQYNDRVIFIKNSYTNLKQIIDDTSFFEINFILCDLGLSSYQLEDRKRGFSFETLGELDLRFSKDVDLTASEIINHWPLNRLKEIFKNYGEERLARDIANKVIEIRSKKIVTGYDLNAICSESYKHYYKGKSKLNPSTKVWQALRIAVNNELDNIKQFLPQALEVLNTNGRLAVITFHSLEDRIVKNYFKKEARDCLCPPEFPVCRCGHKASIKIITKKPMVPKEDEIKFNSRARSAKLRVIEKL